MTSGIDPLKAASIAPKGRPGPSAPAQTNASKIEAGSNGSGSAKAPAAQQREQDSRSTRSKGAEHRIIRKGENDFSVAVDQNTGVMVVRITDNKTGEMVKQIPAQEFIEADLSMEQIVGLIIDDQA